MVANQQLRAIGTFANRLDAEDALNELRSTGFDMNKVSVLAKDAGKSKDIGGARVQDHNRGGDNEAQEGAGIGAVAGTVLGGIGGLLVGLEAILIPGAGPFLAAGTIATTLAGAGIGAAAGSIVGALTGLGIPEEDAQAYGDRVSGGDYLVMVEGSSHDIDRAASLLSSRGIKGWNVYDTSTGRRYDTNIGTGTVGTGTVGTGTVGAGTVGTTPVAHDDAYTRRATAANADIAATPVTHERDLQTRRTTVDPDIVEVVDHRDDVL